MKTHTIKSRTMRTLLITLLFVSGFAFAQPSINNPTPLQVCDDGNDGIETFNLFSKNAEVLGSLNASNHTVSYHETLTDAQNNFNALPSLYNNTVNNQIIYVRVIENSSPTLYSTTTLTLEAVSYPLITPMPNVTVCESYTLPALPFGQNYYTQTFGTGTLLAVGTQIPTTQTIYIFAQTLSIPPCTSESSFTVTVNPIPTYSTPPNLIQNSTTGTAVFDLTVQTGLLLDGDPSRIITYYPSIFDAQNNTNETPTPSAFINNSNPQTIGVRVSDNGTGCYSITNFDLIVNINPFAINNPTPLQICDDNNDGTETFNLFSKNNEILGTLNPLDYIVTYYETITDAQIGSLTTALTNPYQNLNPFNQTVYVRVTNITTSEYVVTTLNLVVNPLLNINQPSNLVENDADGTAVFNLASQTPTIVGSLTDWENGYFLSFEDAQNYTNFIPNPGTFSNTSNPQTIYCGVRSLWTNCVSVTNFDLIVNTNPFPINNPTTLYACDNNNDGFESFNLVSKNAEILGALNPLDYTVSYHETATDAQAGSNSLSSPYINVSFFNQTIYVRVTENANPTTFSTTTLEINATALPFIATTVPNLTVTENPFDGVAIFNLTTQNYYITTIPTQIINFYTTQIDAENQTNAISNPSSFTGNHLQVIWFSLTDPSTGCSTIGSFILNVVNSATVVYIPDVNFKAALLSSSSTIHIGVSNTSGNFGPIDTNFDGEIQFSEAQDIGILYIENLNISDLTGIEAFINIYDLRCSQNNLTTLNLSQNTDLIGLGCNSNQLTNLNISNSINITSLNCADNQLTTLNIDNNINLQYFTCSYNQLSSLNLNTLTNLIYFECTNNNLTSLNVNNLNNLTQIRLDNNQLTSLSLNNLPSLSNLEVNVNQLSSLDVSTLPNLLFLMCQSNSLTNINFGTISNLSVLACSNNLLTSLNLNNLTQLTGFYCFNNPFTTLDLTQNINLGNISISSCANLETIFMKNGYNEVNPGNYLNCSNLIFICADEDQISDIQSQLIANGNTTCVVNSYCTFTPGGTYNTLTGTATFDINNNGCDALDIPFNLLGLNVSLNGVSTNSSVFTNNSGVYNLYTNVVGEYQLSPNFENPTYYNVSPVVQTFPVIDNSTATQNICITANGVHPDLEIVIAPITPARPGFDALYQIVYKNKGNQTLTGSFNFNYDDAKLDFISASVSPSTITTGVITWNYANLLPFENRTVYVTLNVNSPVEIPAVNIGEILTFSSTINPITGDETQSDNTFTYAQTVVGSYDPNDITCMEGETVSPSEIGEYLHYVINFENTGNYYAENVVVKIEIDETKYDINSLQLLNTSHESKSKITNNVVEFIFEDINLVAASGNPPVGGHGNVLFKIKSKNNLVTGDMVQKTAKIYFDYNAPIDTNISQTTYQSLNNPIFEFDESVKVYPNPTQSIININSNFNIKSVELYDVQGRILEKSFENNTTTTLNLSERQSGIYFVKITSDKGSKVEKVVKN